jgi:hypothetical protein
LTGGFTELGIDFGMPLVNPRQQLIETGQQRREPFGVPAVAFAGVVVRDQGGRLLQMVSASPADDQRRITFGLAVG